VNDRGERQRQPVERGEALEPAARRVKRIGFVLLYLLTILLSLELASRLFWTVRHGVSFLSPNLLYAFYPELESAQSAADDAPENAIDILLLGGSVFHEDFSTVPSVLQRRLEAETGRPVRIRNLARAAHTSRDSYLKYELLKDRKFDLVLFYHGINEARANNSPPAVFRDDYSHYSWYENIQRLRSHRESRYLVLPYTLAYLWSAVSERIGFTKHVPIQEPRPDWLVYGRQVKTERSFRMNLERILERAKERDEPVLLMTFATHVPPDYTHGRFIRKELDYGWHSLPIELWGVPAQVQDAVRRHNAVVEQLAGEHGTLFVDQDHLIPKTRTYFNDVCHLTPRGGREFVSNIEGPVLERLAGEPFPKNP
jgi:hypothetical protein